MTAGASMLVNKHNRDRAAREAAPQWRNFGEVGVHITDQRLVTTIDGRLESLWYYGGVTLFDPKWEEYAAYVGVEGAPPLRFVGAGVSLCLSACLLSVVRRGPVDDDRTVIDDDEAPPLLAPLTVIAALVALKQIADSGGAHRGRKRSIIALVFRTLPAPAILL